MRTFSYQAAQISILAILFQILQPIVGFAAYQIDGPTASSNEQVLFSLPIPLTRYNLDGDITFKLSADSQKNILILPVRNTVKNNSETVGRLFINGVLKGDFKGVSLADFTEKNNDLIYRTWDGKSEMVYGLPNFKSMDPLQAQKILAQMKQPGFLEKLIQKTKTDLERFKTPEEESKKYIQNMQADGYLDQMIGLRKQWLEAQVKKEGPLTSFIEKKEDSNSGIRGIMQNNQEGTYLVMVSPGFARAQIMLFKNGALAAQHNVPPYFYIGQNNTHTKFTYRGQELNGLYDSEVMVIDNGEEGERYAWTSQPTYNNNDEVMYMAATAIPREKDDKTPITCKAVIGKTTKDVQCNDPLFFSLTFQSPYFRFPVMSPDGQTTVYPELTKAGSYKNNNYTDGIKSPFESRLVVNGEARESHPYIDKPFFTSKGLAILSYNSKDQQYVEWNGIKSPQFQAIGTSFIETLGFRGMSPLYAALSSFDRGDLGVDEIKPELIVSPDGKSIAFAGYNKDGWTVMRDMKVIGTYKYADQFAYSPDSKHLAYVAVTGNFDPLSNQSFWLGENSTQSTDVVSSVMIDGKEVNKHEKVLYLQYSPEGVLTYIGRSQKQYTLYLNGKAVGNAFDRIIMEPRFKDGMVEVVGARSDKIILLKLSLNNTGMTKEMPVNLDVSEQNPVSIPPRNIDQSSLKLIETVKDGAPPKLKPMRIGTKKSSIFYTDGKAVFSLSIARIENKVKTYNVYLLDGETPSAFKIMNEYYAVGKKAYSSATSLGTTISFTGLVTYDGSSVSIISDDVKTFTALGKYATDGKHAFYLSEIIQADVPSFHPLNTYFAKDKFSVFVGGSGYLEADADSFKSINDQCGADKKAFYCGDGAGAVELPLMDAKTFKYLHDGVAYDSKKVVYRTDALPELDPVTFKFLDTNSDRYLLDKRAVYLLTSCMGDSPKCKLLKQIEGADPATFSIVPVNSLGQAYVKDKKHVWRSEYLVEGADGSTFAFLDQTSGYAKDKKHVFYGSNLIIGADVKTFKLLEPMKAYGAYGADSKHVFYRGEMMKDVNPKTFKPPVEK